ncbi:DNA-binding MarR family transcriptional regulator [Paenibacillus endophyticus]|uniref:DNA-binding MarR family transcriptional regulator n=1 Tax=Paenibacillus endophyticus TaxID=1294268 RepID=A0A7W5C785_9BACL|nr:MarR family winged helix-turn-helix transcriptional regulator [Paenibacillus endophyticus]MBB3151399.1 DNA-binding MarR family transcriptional regulator [Paenibacillus endophyticus]
MKDLQDYVHDLPLPTQVFFSLVETTARLVDVSEKYWQSRGQNGARIRILVEIMKEGGTILPSMLAQKIGVTKSNVTLLLIPLENEGFIQRASHPSDGRKTIISITPEGQTLLLNHLPENRARITDKMSKLSGQELAMLLSLLSKLNKP